MLHKSAEHHSHVFSKNASPADFACFFTFNWFLWGFQYNTSHSQYDQPRFQLPPLWLCFACMRAKSFQSCLTLCDPVDCSLPGSSVYGILQARILEWVAMTSFRGSSHFGLGESRPIRIKHAGVNVLIVFGKRVYSSNSSGDLIYIAA